ncbi:MAG TPA: hypothetical protein DCE41_12985 [Cytophagales bacterium]|nr:hypothetical protein [Cytophagales bacterium]HAA20920.1 hypothetical protein [Cytophagales bacterium]HAP60604.1 hypothetical protein [Cytophagales bacterium]
MSDIKLNFINESNDANNSSVVIFQKNVATDFDELAIAWKVIKNCGTGWHHEFTYPMTMFLSAADSWGNELVSPMVAQNGQLFHVTTDGSGSDLSYSGPSPSRKEVQMRNDLNQGSIDARIYKDGKLLALKTGVSPGQKAVFQFKPSIWIGVVSQIEEGQVMNSAILSDVNTEIGLLSVASADIVMTGGGTGPNATPFKFTLDNVQYV